MQDAVAGIDVSATRGLDAAVMLRDGRLVETAWLPGVDALRTWLEVWAERLMVVAVDAPGGVARLAGGRRAEQAFRALGVSLYSTPVTIAEAPSWMRVGWQVYELLAEIGFPEARAAASSPACAIECYPYAAYVALSRARRPSAERAPAWARRILKAGGYELSGTGKDAADAVAAALTARAYALGDAVAYGDPDEGVIWAPRTVTHRAAASGAGSTERDDADGRTADTDQVRRDNRAGCECGCGKTPAGRRSRFLPGHDAILYARRRREGPVREVDEPTP